VALCLKVRDDLIAVIALNLHDAVLGGTARAAQAFERTRNVGERAFRNSGDDRHGARSAALAKNTHDAVVGYARCAFLLHCDALRQARSSAPPNAVRDMRVAIFCGARSGTGDRYAEIASAAARAIILRGAGIVYGGGRVGLMGVVADAALQAGGEVIGVIPHALAGEEIAHGGITQLHVVDSMHERKALMAELSDGFVALPGGFGTMDEFCEIVTWAQLRIHAKPVGLLNAGGYYDELLALFDKMVREGFVTPRNRGLVLSAASIDALLGAMFPG